MPVVPTEADHVQFLKEPHDWPNNPICPVKRLGKTFDPDGLGIIVRGHPVVVLLTMWQHKITVETIEAAKKIQFESFEALVDAGWRVD